MRILHYALGFPPYRSGGLTKFCVDLMEQQRKEGHQVSLLWPGKMISFHRHTFIKKHKDNGTIGSYEVYNPTPISYDEGIVDIELFMECGDKQTYIELLNDLKVDVLHVHTLMGLHKSLLDAAKDLSVKIVFTAHDFFPICPKVTMYRNGVICECAENCGSCASCNRSALSINKIKILQSGFYRSVKGSSIVKAMRKKHRDTYLSEESSANAECQVPVRNQEDYKNLRQYYNSLLNYMDIIHYNSTITKQVYEKYMDLGCVKNEVIPISHSNIKDCRKKKDYKNDTLRITYLGPAGRGKGYYLLKEALDSLWSELGKNKTFDWNGFTLGVFFSPKEKADYMQVGDRYTYNQLEEIFDNTDVLIVPSVWNETFGYTVIEALSFGVPVIISGTVGARDILQNDTGIIIEDITSAKLADTIHNLSKDGLRKMNENILCMQNIMTVSDMSRLIYEKCYEIV